MWFFVRSPYNLIHDHLLTGDSLCTVLKKTDLCFWDGSILGTIDLLMSNDQNLEHLGSGSKQARFSGCERNKGVIGNR